MKVILPLPIFGFGVCSGVACVGAVCKVNIDFNDTNMGAMQQYDSNSEKMTTSLS